MNKNSKKLLTVALNFVVFEGIYQLALYFEEKYFPMTPVCFPILVTVTASLFLIYIVMTKGYPEKPHTPDMLRQTIPYDERVTMCEKINKNKEKAKKLLYFIIPLLFVTMIDVIMTFVFPQFFER